MTKTKLKILIAIMGFLAVQTSVPALAQPQQNSDDSKTGQQVIPNSSERIRTLEEQARVAALLEALLATYKSVLQGDNQLTPEQQRQYANSLDRSRIVIPELAQAIGEIYSKFKGDRILVGASFGIGGEKTFFKNNVIPLVNKVPFVGDLATGADASVGVAGFLVRNSFDNVMYPQFSGYYSVGVNEGKGYGEKIAEEGLGRGSTQGYWVWRMFLAPKNFVSSQTEDISTVLARIPDLAGAYFGGRGDIGTGIKAFGLSGFQTAFFGHWNFQNAEESKVSQAVPQVVMLSFAPTMGFKGPHLSAQAGVQYIDFFGIQRK
jgi:hypothetical protein